MWRLFIYEDLTKCNACKSAVKLLLHSKRSFYSSFTFSKVFLHNHLTFNVISKKMTSWNGGIIFYS